MKSYFPWWWGLGAVCALICSSAALAADPRCQTPFDPANQPYPAPTNLVAFCTEEVDLDGNTLQPDDVDSCELSINSDPPIALANVDPGMYYEIQVPPNVKDIHTVDLKCFDDGNAGPSADVTQVKFRTPGVGKPHFILLP